MQQHNSTSLDLIEAKTNRDLAMWTNDGRLASDLDPQLQMVIRIDGLLKSNKPGARWISAPHGEVPLCRYSRIVVGARRSDDASHSVIWALSCHNVTWP